MPPPRSLEEFDLAFKLRLHARAKREQQVRTEHWRDWLATNYEPYTRSPFAARMIRLWDWIDALTPGTRPRPRAECWPRGSGKSTTAELGVIRALVRGSRRFVLYISSIQPQADKHVESIGVAFERLGTGRAVNQYGQSRGWRHNELHTAEGGSVIALGLDAAARGIKIDQFRPDLIVLDDIDERSESDESREKKIVTLTQSILPAGSDDLAVLFVQNLIHSDSMMAKLIDGRADFLRDVEIGAFQPAIIEPVIEAETTDDGVTYHITGGEPTWEGQNLAVCERQIATWGLTAFRREAQHETDEVEGGMWNRNRDIEPWRIFAPPDLVALTVAVDPSATRGGDEAGITVCGKDARRHGYLLADVSLRASPGDWAKVAVRAFHEWRAKYPRAHIRMVAEKNNGGEMVDLTIGTVRAAPPVRLITSSKGKATRAQPVQRLSQEGKLHHVGYFPELERELCTWKEGMPSPNRLDSFVFGITDLLLPPRRPNRPPAVGGVRPELLGYRPL